MRLFVLPMFCFIASASALRLRAVLPTSRQRVRCFARKGGHQASPPSVTSKKTNPEMQKLADKLVDQLLSQYSSVTVQNTQKSIPIDLAEVEKHTEILKKILNVPEFEVDVLFCSEAKIRELNREWRGKSKSTDVLSFPANKFSAPEVFDAESKATFKHFGMHLGDITIAPVYVQRQCDNDRKDCEEAKKTAEGKAEIEAEWASDAGVNKAMAKVFTVQDRVPLLLIHSLLHLLGYDHETDEEWEQMTKREEEVMKLFYEQISGQ